MGLSSVKDGAPEVAERNDNDKEKNELDAFGKGKGKGKNTGKCSVCGGDGHYAPECPSVARPNIGTQECYGYSGKGQKQSSCPAANPHLKGQGKGQGQGWQGKGDKDGSRKEKDTMEGRARARAKARDQGKEKACTSLTL